MKLFPVLRKRAKKPCIWHNLLSCPSMVAGWDAAQFMNCLTKPIRSSKRNERNEENDYVEKFKLGLIKIMYVFLAIVRKDTVIVKDTHLI